MAIKIDLLPGYVGLRRVRKALTWSALVLVSGTAGVLFLVYYKGQQQLTVLETNLDNVEANAKAAEKADAAAKKATSDAAPVATLVDFLTAASRTGAERAALLDLTSHYIYSGAVINSIDYADGKATISATVKSPEDYKALLLDLRQGSKTNGGLLFAADPKTSMVTASGIPGFPAKPPLQIPTPGELPVQIQFPIGVNIVGTLEHPVVLPTEPTAGGGGGAPEGAGPPLPPV